MNIPKIYAFSEPQYEAIAWSREGKNGTIQQGKGYLKIGYTTRDVHTRIKEQFSTKRPNKEPYKIVLTKLAITKQGKSFDDRLVHKALESSGIQRINGEWFACEVEELEAILDLIIQGKDTKEVFLKDFALRPEQQEAIKKTSEFFATHSLAHTGRIPHFLWNAKMRFGKTFATYSLAKQMGFSKVLVLTFKPAVKNAWEEDLAHKDFKEWQFISKDSKSYEDINPKKPFVWFASFQDALGKNKNGGIKLKNEQMHKISWDLIVLDEYHFGAWNENSKELYIQDLQEKELQDEARKIQDYDEEMLSKVLRTKAYLYLSGTPFRALYNGEFLEDNMFSWTYVDEQKAKREFAQKHPNSENPYASLPEVKMYVYKIDDKIANVAKNGEFDEFSLNEFFRVANKEFVHKDEVLAWLSFIKGQYNIEHNLKIKKPILPFFDSHMIYALRHTFWFLPNIAACEAMAEMLKKDSFFKEYIIIVCAGNTIGIGEKALKSVQAQMGNPLETKSITLSCGKLTTGVSVKAWSGIFMLKDTKSPETYFQSAFRVQTPWSVRRVESSLDSSLRYKDLDTKPNDIGEQLVIKECCYIFDFAPNRALAQITDYATRLNESGKSPSECVGEFIQFLPVLMYDGNMLKEINAQDLLDFSISGQAGSMLARKFESAMLVNVDNATLERLLASKEALATLEKIESFRGLSKDVEKIINASKEIKDAKTKNKDLNPKEKRELTQEEKEIKSKRKKIQESLINFAKRVPIFMYLSDYREEMLQDIIMKLEPELFTKVTGLKIDEFSLLCEFEVFNTAIMNEAIFAFKRYEDYSLPNEQGGFVFGER